MRLALSSEQLDFAGILRELLEDAKVPEIVRLWATGDTEPGIDLWQRLADTGAAGLAVDEDFGGLGAEPADLVVAFIELGRACVPGPLVETAAALPALLASLDDTALAQRWLPALASGHAIGSFVIDPTVPRALDGDVAHLLLRVDGRTLHSARPTEVFESVDPARRLFAVRAESVAAEGNDVAAAAQNALNLGTLACAAQLLGAGEAVVDMSTEYAKSRVQFGRPIGGFQAVKHHLADAKVGLELARPLVYGAAVALASNEPVAAVDVSAAKVACSDAAYVAARKALQVHGAIGYTAEYDLALWLTKIRALVSAWGTPSYHRSRIAEALR